MSSDTLEVPVPSERRVSLPATRRITVPAALALGFAMVFVCAPAGRASAACSGDYSSAGHATAYSYAPGSGQCSFVGDDSDPMVAAANPVDWAGSQMCGRYVHVTGPLGSVDVRIVDECPSCAAGDLDMNTVAFSAIANLSDGRVAINWHTIPDPTGGNIGVHISSATNPYYMQIQPRHGRYGIASVEFLSPSGYLAVPRGTDNYFNVDYTFAGPSGLLPDPFTIRMTDVNGQVVTQAGIPIVAGSTFASSVQFPACEGTAAADAEDSRDLTLHAPVPNPLGHSALLSFELAREGDVTLRIFDAGGRRVRTVLDQHLSAGSHQLRWQALDDNGRSLPSGVYFARLSSASRSRYQRLVIAD